MEQQVYRHTLPTRKDLIMGTRSIIARPAGDGFEGRYCHWDGYPDHNGYVLWHAVTEHFRGDAAAARTFYIEQHTDWSSITWPFDANPHARDRNLEKCTECGRPCWMHYRQYYSGQYNTEGLPTPSESPFNDANVFDHKFGYPDTTGQSICHCHDTDGNKVADHQDWMLTSWGDDAGTEWAYVLADKGMSVFERLWGDSAGEGAGTHMMGMFGFGASVDGSWKFRGFFPWDGPEPNWEKLDPVEVEESV